ncbi:MAG: DUF1624 domain-containing protein [Bacteroidetes bacterium]|nr:DUF1624 domain-containing protein [Bacteroidota bacterium]
MNTKNRALFIDLLRGLAMLVMVEVHVTNELLEPSIKSQSWFSIVNFINGLVAPSFLFVSGLVFVLSLQKGVDDLRKFGKTFWKKLSRIGLILLAGYSLHTPYFSVQKLMNHWTPDIIKQLFMVDILQCIGIGLLVLLFARIIFTNEKSFYIFITVVLFFVVSFSWVFWKIDFNNFLPIPLASYFNTMNGSLFPVFPWFNFLFAGALVSKFYIDTQNKNDEKNFIRKITIIGIGFLIVGDLLLRVVVPKNLEIIRPHPAFFIERLGAVFAILGGCWYYVRNKENYSSFILDASRESLLVYWLHLQVIFRKFFGGKSLVDIYGGQLNIYWCILITIAICVLMIYAAKLWGWTKGHHPKISKKIVYGFITAGLAIFVINGIFLLDL